MKHKEEVYSNDVLGVTTAHARSVRSSESTRTAGCATRLMNAEEYLHIALGGNMNISTLKPLAWHEIMEAYAEYRIKGLKK